MVALKEYFQSPKFTVFFSMAMITIFLMSCVASQLAGNVVSSLYPSVEEGIDYKSPTFSSAQLYNKGVALLPIFAEREVEIYKQMFGKAVNKAADSAFSNFMQWENISEILKEEELMLKYNNEIRSYQEIGILSPSILRELSELTRKEYFLFIELEPYEPEEEGFEESFYMDGTDMSSMKNLGASGVIWSASDGRVVWEGFTNMHLNVDDYRDNRNAETALVEKVTRKLIENISGS